MVNIDWAAEPKRMLERKAMNAALWSAIVTMKRIHALSPGVTGAGRTEIEVRPGDWRNVVTANTRNHETTFARLAQVYAPRRRTSIARQVKMAIEVATGTRADPDRDEFYATDWGSIY